MDKDPIIKQIYEDIQAKDSRLVTVKNKIQQLQEEKESLEKELSVLKPYFQKLLQDFNIDATQYNLISSMTSTIKAPRKKRSSISDEAYKILANSKQPLSIHDLTKILISENKIHTKAKNPMTSVASALSRDSRFEAFGKGMWKVKPKQILEKINHETDEEDHDENESLKNNTEFKQDGIEQNLIK